MNEIDFLPLFWLPVIGSRLSCCPDDVTDDYCDVGNDNGDEMDAHSLLIQVNSGMPLGNVLIERHFWLSS